MNFSLTFLGMQYKKDNQMMRIWVVLQALYMYNVSRKFEIIYGNHLIPFKSEMENRLKL